MVSSARSGEVPGARAVAVAGARAWYVASSGGPCEVPGSQPAVLEVPDSPGQCSTLPDGSGCACSQSAGTFPA